MLFQLIFLALALSVDSFGIGVSYGVRKISLSPVSILIISLMSLGFSTISVFFGNLISIIFSEKITSFISIVILILMGLFIIKKGVESEDENKIKELKIKSNKKIFSLFIKSLGITISVIKTPSSCDLDNSKIIEHKEAFYLGTALSIDCIGVGIAVSSFNSYSFLFPILIVIFQIIFLNTGVFIGKKLNLKKLNESSLSIISGIILILIGGLRIIIK